MKNKALMASAMACTVLLTGCGTTNMLKKFDDELAYTLGDYTAEVDEEASVDTRKVWNLTYTGKNGRERVAVIEGERFDKEQKKYYDNSRMMNDSLYWDFYANELMDIGSEEMFSRILSKHFGLTEDGEPTDENIRSCYAFTLFFTICYVEPNKDFFEQYTSAENGVKLSELDMESLARDKNLTTSVILNLKEGVDPEPYIAEMEKVADEYIEITGNPQNYKFSVNTYDEGENSRSVWRRTAMLGEEYDLEKAQKEAEAAGKKFSSTSALREKLYPDW